MNAICSAQRSGNNGWPLTLVLLCVACLTTLGRVYTFRTLRTGGAMYLARDTYLGLDTYVGDDA